MRRANISTLVPLEPMPQRPAVEPILQRAFNHIHNLFARMRMPGGHHSRGELDEHLDHLASGDAQIVPLEIGTIESRLLRPGDVQRQTASDDQHRCRYDASGCHVAPFLFRVFSAAPLSWARLAAEATPRRRVDHPRRSTEGPLLTICAVV